MVREREIDGILDHQWPGRIIKAFRHLKAKDAAPTLRIQGVQDAHLAPPLRLVEVCDAVSLPNEAGVALITDIHDPSRARDSPKDCFPRLIAPERMNVVRRLWGDRRPRTLVGPLVEDTKRGACVCATTCHSPKKGDNACTDKRETTPFPKKTLHVFSP